MEENPITKRFIEVYNSQLATGAVKRDAAFARNAGTTPQNLNEILQGRSNPGLKIIQKIVENYGVSADWLLTGKGEMYPTPSEEKRPTPYIEDRVKELEQKVLDLEGDNKILSRQLDRHNNRIKQLFGALKMDFENGDQQQAS